MSIKSIFSPDVISDKEIEVIVEAEIAEPRAKITANVSDEIKAKGMPSLRKSPTALLPILKRRKLTKWFTCQPLQRSAE